MKKIYLYALATGLASSLCTLPLTTQAAVDFPEAGDIDGSGFDDDLEVGEEDGDDVDYYYSYWLRDYFDAGNNYIYHFDLGYLQQKITLGDGFYFYDYRLRIDNRFTDDSYATYDDDGQAEGLWIYTRRIGWVWAEYDRSTPKRRLVYVYNTRRYRYE